MKQSNNVLKSFLFSFDKSFFLISLLFFIGSALGVLTSLEINFSSDSFFGTDVLEIRSFFDLLIFTFRYPVLILICGTSFFGVLFVPVTALIKGFLLSFSSSYLFAFFNYAFASKAFLLFALFQLVSTVVLILLMRCSFNFSFALFRSAFYKKFFSSHHSVVDYFKVSALYLAALFFFDLIFYFIFL